MTKNHGTIECDECGKETKKKAGNQRYCPECRGVVRKRKLSGYRNKFNTERPDYHTQYQAQQRQKMQVGDTTQVTPDPWKNLMLGVLAQAKAENDIEFLEEFGPMFEEAITCQSARTETYTRK